ncbi:MAG: hypothetical protein WD492_06010 [Alkalispirochaeta sp.]
MAYEAALATRPPSDIAIEAIRWAPAGVPATCASGASRNLTFEVVPGVFDYGAGTSSEAHWCVNFADPKLFVAHGTPLFAQDGLQVAVHPALGCLREALIADGYSTAVEDTDEKPTPFTITGVPRRVAIDTTTGLYGNGFSRASLETVRDAVRPVAPEARSNILVIAAPRPGTGTYDQEEISAAMVAAYTGFAATGAHIPAPVTTIHTDFWGCGAFGGNRTLMMIIQAAAAEAAGVHVVFHTFDDARVTVAKEAHNQYRYLRATAKTSADLISATAGNPASVCTAVRNGRRILVLVSLRNTYFKTKSLDRNAHPALPPGPGERDQRYGDVFPWISSAPRCASVSTRPQRVSRIQERWRPPCIPGASSRLGDAPDRFPVQIAPPFAGGQDLPLIRV